MDTECAHNASQNVHNWDPYEVVSRCVWAPPDMSRTGQKKAVREKEAAGSTKKTVLITASANNKYVHI